MYTFIITLIQGRAKQFVSSARNRATTYQTVLEARQILEVMGTQNPFSYITSSIYL